jgi:membrane associated rhomboid family serine protease
MIFPGDVFFDKQKMSSFIKSDRVFNVGMLLLIINISVYLFFTLPEYLNDQKLLQIINKNKTVKIKTLQSMYLQTVDPILLNKSEPPAYTSLSFLKDQLFWLRAESFPFIGDSIEIQKNKKIISEIKRLYTLSSQYKLGLGQAATTPGAWLTYQFTHAGFLHLLMNMFFLILIINILAVRIEAGWILTVYTLGGLGAGISYLMLSGPNDISMLGASGSLCALIAFLCTVEHKKNIQWSYFLSPMKNGYGIIYMPAFLLFPVYLLSDFTAVLYHANGVDGSVAHSAHIGGALTGFILGFSYLFWRKASAHRIFSDNNGLHKLL